MQQDLNTRFGNLATKLSSDSSNYISQIIALTNRFEADSANVETALTNLNLRVDTVNQDLIDEILTQDSVNISLGSRITADSTNFESRFGAVQQALQDSSFSLRSQQQIANSQLQTQISAAYSAIRADLGDSLSTLNSQLSTNLTDSTNNTRALLAESTSQLRTELQTANSQQLAALSDTASNIRSEISLVYNTLLYEDTLVRQALNDSTIAIRSDYDFKDEVDSTNLHLTIIDSSNALKSQLKDTASTLRSLISTSGSDDQNLTLTNKQLSIESGNSLDLRSLSDSAISANIDSSAAIRASLSTLNFRLTFPILLHNYALPRYKTYQIQPQQ